MDKTRAKIKSTSMTAFVAILAIALLFGIQTSIDIFDWLTTGEALSNPDSVRHGMGLLGDGLLVALAVYVALVFLRINREETPFFANLPRKIKRWPCSFRDARGAEVAVLGSRQHPNRNAVRRSRGRIGHVRPSCWPPSCSASGRSSSTAISSKTRTSRSSRRAAWLSCCASIG